MTPNSVVNLGGVMVGDGHPTVFVAEVGTFFNQDIALAERYLQAVADAGAPVFKTEILHNPDVCLRNSRLLHEYQHAGGSKVEVYRELIERKCNPLSEYRRLFEICQGLGIPFIATVYDLEGIDFLVEVGAAGIKIARTNIDNVPLIRHAARTGLPIVYDAGVVYVEEIARAVRLAQAEGTGGVIVNHHPGKNPAPPAIHNMGIMQSYKDMLGIPVGLSCHHTGDEMLYLAVGMGANLLEKGVVDDPARVDQDLVSAARLSDMKEIIRKVHNCWLALGKNPPQPQEPRDLSVRSGLVAKRDIRTGETFGQENLYFAWPPAGISVGHWDLVAGNQASRDVPAHQPVQWTDVRFRQDAAGESKV